MSIKRAKPPLGAQIDWSAPLARGLVGAWLLNEGSGRIVRDLVGGVKLVNAQVLNIEWRGSPYFRQSGAFVAGTGPSIANGPFTLAFATSKLEYNGSKLFLSLGSALSTDQFIHFRAETSTTFRFGLLSDDLDVTLPVSLDNRTVAWVASLDDKKAQKVYENGQLRGSRTAGNFFTGDRTVTIGGGATTTYDAEIHYFYIYNRALSAQEAASLSADPYQVIRQPGRLLVPMMGAATGVGPIVGSAGASLAIALGANGTLINDIEGSAGASLAIALGADGSLATQIVGSTGAALAITPGSNGDFGLTINGYQGVEGALLAISPGTTGSFLAATSRRFTILIDGVDVSRYVANPSLEISDQLGGRATAAFKVIPKDGVNYAPAVGDEIIIIHNASSTRLFAGFIENTSRKNWTGPSGHYEINVRCSDYGQLLDRRLVAKFYNAANGSIAGIITYDIVDKFLAGTGISWYPMGGDGYVGDEILFNWVTAAEAISSLADRANVEYRVDQFKRLGYIDKTTGSGAAPFSIVQNDGNWRELEITEDRTRFFNSVKVRSSQDVAALWTDTVEATGEHIYFTQYPLDAAPVLLIDGVEVDESIICEFDERASTPGYQWYYIAGSPGLHHNQAFPAPDGVDVDITYPSKVSHVAIAEDQSSIDAVGLYEAIEEAKDVTSLDALQQYADNLLARGSLVPVGFNVETDRVGLFPGQVLTINANGVSGDFLIEQVEMREIQKDYPRWTARGSNAPQRATRGTNFFSKLMTAARQPVDRIDSSISFTLAETINGDTNPGLEVFTPAAYRTARKPGYIKLVRLGFGSISSGTLTEDDIEIDVLQNGVSIFPVGGNKMRLRAGRTTPVSKFRFANSPMRVEAGDEFTIDILSADSTAMDGWLDIQIVGG